MQSERTGKLKNGFLIPFCIAFSAHAALVALVAFAAFRLEPVRESELELSAIEFSFPEIVVETAQTDDIAEATEAKAQEAPDSESADEVAEPVADNVEAQQEQTVETVARREENEAVLAEAMQPAVEEQVDLPANAENKPSDTTEAAQVTTDDEPVTEDATASASAMTEDKPASAPATTDDEPVTAKTTQTEDSPQASTPTESPLQARTEAPPMPEASIRPVYPRRSRRRGEEGDVKLAFTVSEEGKAHGIAIAESSGFKELDNAAIKAIANAKFKPAESNGKKVPAKTSMTLSFRLK